MIRITIKSLNFTTAEIILSGTGYFRKSRRLRKKQRKPMASAPKMGEQLLLLILSATCVQFVLCQLQPQQHQFPNPQPIAGQPSTMLPQGMPNMDPNMLQMGQPMIPPPQVVPQMQDTAGSVSNEDSDQNGPPGVAMEYKIHIEPGKEECFYQYVEPGATFYVSFQVSFVL